MNYFKEMNLERRKLEASNWCEVMLQDSLDADTLAAFQAWMQHDENRKAYDVAQALLNRFESLANHPELQLLSAETSARLQKQREKAQKHPFNLFKYPFGLVAGLAFTLLVYSYYSEPAPVVYSALTGEQKNIQLEDGSRVFLNANSDIQVFFDKKQRLIQLNSGQAVFEVASDIGRPFVVLTQYQKVVSDLAQFDVNNYQEDHLEVTVVEGEVRVDSITLLAGALTVSDSNESYQITASQMLLAETGAEPLIFPVNAQRRTSWLRGKLYFENEPLKNVIAQVNRHIETPINLASPALGDLLISGQFNLGDLSHFTAGLSKQLPWLDMKIQSGFITLSEKIM